MRFPAVSLLAGLFLIEGVKAADWPRWRGPANDGHVPVGTAALATLPAEPTVLWEIAAGEGLASPVVAGEQVFAFDNQDGRETLRALDRASGRPLWSADIDEPFSDSQGPTGPRNTPVVDGDRVYAVSCRGELQCRQVSDGSLVWRANFVKDFHAVFIGEKGSAPGAARHGNNASPLIDGDHLLACVGGTHGAGVVCFEKRTGQVVWKNADDQAGYAPPVVATIEGVPQVICYTAVGVIGLRRGDGELLWRVPVKTAFARHVTTPVVLGNRIVVSSHEVGLLGLRATRRGETWSAEVAWVNKPAAINYASPVARNGFLYGIGPNRDVICVAIETGELRWSQPDVFATAAGKSYGGLIAMGDRILMMTDSGELMLFGAQPEGYQEFGRIQVCGLNWCNPALADGTLYLRDGMKQNGRWKAIRLEP